MENKKKRIKKLIAFSVLVVFLISLITFLLFVSPEEIVDNLGVRNGYIILFIVSFFGGFSSGGAFSFISFLVTLVAGGMNPIHLALIAGVSLALGDMIMFYAGSRGRDLVKGKWDKKIDRVTNLLKKRKWTEKAIPVFAYLYMGFTPLPNDILLLSLAAVEYPQKKMNVIIILGDLTFALMLTMLAVKGVLVFG